MLKLKSFAHKPKKCAENNGLLFQDFQDKEAMALDFATILMEVLDEAAKGDVYLTIGTTRDKSSFTASLSVNGNRESVYESDAISLILAFTGFLDAALHSDAEAEDGFMTHSADSWDKEENEG